MRLSNAEQMRAVDRRAITAFKIPSIRLMESAARAVARASLPFLTGGKYALIFCGSGNNGGDGVGAAVELKRAGFPLRVLLTGSPDHMTPDTAEMSRRLSALGAAVEEYVPGAVDYTNAAVIIDAIFGIGLNKPVSGKALAAIREINASGLPVISADIASGVEADTGRVLGDAVNAAVTVTFSLAKPGHFAEPGGTHCGKLQIVDIGIPPEVLADAVTSVHAVTDADVRLPRRDPLSHKGDYGKLLLLGGSVGFTGAPTLCARAAVRAGAGLVYLGVPAPIYEITAVKNDEAMPFPLPAKGGGFSAAAAAPALEKLGGCTVCAIGPGMGRSAGAAALTEAVLRCAPPEMPLVLDADALNALAEHPDWLNARKNCVPPVLTPHAGEFARLGGILTGDRIADARRFAQEHGCVMVLKGHRCVAAFPDGAAFIATRGNAGMAKGGSGDALTGILAALLGQFPGQQKRAVCAGMQLHALAGDLCRDRLGEYSMTASDLVETLPAATRLLTEE